jgi:hypothetical protein
VLALTFGGRLVFCSPENGSKRLNVAGDSDLPGVLPRRA